MAEENSQTSVGTGDSGRLDKLGVWISGLCAVHCLALPLLLPIAPVIASSFFAEHWFERVILSLSVVIGFAAMFIGFHQYHRQLYPLYSLAAGALIYWNKDALGHELEPFTVTVGAALIIGAHVLNLRLCRQCKGCK
ncbi:MerC domain-containing protein [Agaribacter flavus]|uniref:MerC domain-containing protein n=1 Tax=Agaribacter flavus TaxID=1902781 RepID=A0ABV7FV83_9ALTE